MSRVWMIAILIGLGLAADEKTAAKKLESRVNEYLELRKQAVAGLPKLKSKADPEQIQANKQALADAIRQARKQAKQGEILEPGIASYLQQIVRSEMKGAEGKAAKETAKVGNPRVESPSTPVPVQVNATYPDSAPASTVPPTMLLRLPELPKAVDFRFVGRHLVLRDIDAGLIVDFIPNVMP